MRKYLPEQAYEHRTGHDEIEVRDAQNHFNRRR